MIAARGELNVCSGQRSELVVGRDSIQPELLMIANGENL